MAAADAGHGHEVGRRGAEDQPRADQRGAAPARPSARRSAAFGRTCIPRRAPRRRRSATARAAQRPPFGSRPRRARRRAGSATTHRAARRPTGRSGGPRAASPSADRSRSAICGIRHTSGTSAIAVSPAPASPGWRRGTRRSCPMRPRPRAGARRRGQGLDRVNAPAARAQAGCRSGRPARCARGSRSTVRQSELDAAPNATSRRAGASSAPDPSRALRPGPASSLAVASATGAPLDRCALRGGGHPATGRSTRTRRPETSGGRS